VKQRELMYAGKAKTVYRTDTPGELIVQFRDDITAFDGGKKDVLADKGACNARVSAQVFGYLETNGVRTHFLRMLDPHRMLVRALDMMPLEVIIRNIAAGSMIRNFPVVEGTPLNPPVIVIDYKDDARHDPMLNDDLIVALGLLDSAALAEVKAIALRINRLLSAYLDARGITLVDFKLEFGTQDKVIYVGDEISMDSMRLWDKKTKQSLDKDVYRFDKGDVISTYQAVAERILAPPPGGEH
jgi:phosphoribosylaminoimidazole-succinocarboxamide synthase